MSASIEQIDEFPGLLAGERSVQPSEALTAGFRMAMRNLASGVSIVTVRDGEEVSGITATSVISLSVDPPALLVSINRSSATWPLIQNARRFSVNLLAPGHEDIADTFAGRRGLKGRARYGDSRWREEKDHVPYLADAVSVVECALDEVLHRYTHVLVIGRVVNVIEGNGHEPLVYWRGGYRALSDSTN